MKAFKNSEEKITVAIADDHPAVRQGVRRLLERAPEIEVVAEASDGQEALEIVEEMEPDVLILDILMPVMDGITVIEMLNAMEVETVILVLTSIDDPVFKKESLSVGACGYLCKDEVIQLADVIKHTARGNCGDTSAKPGAKSGRYVMIY